MQQDANNPYIIPLSSLLTVIQHELKVDAKKISAAWPTNEGMQPTPRAITERLVKIRANSRAAGAGHFGMSLDLRLIEQMPNVYSFSSAVCNVAFMLMVHSSQLLTGMS